jgi:beta-phosphoglucomutase
MLKAIVFDFDGVIANSEPLHFAAYRDVLAADGISLTERDYFDKYLGYDDEGAFQTIGRDNGRRWSGEHVADMIVRKSVRMGELTDSISILFPGAADVVRRAAREVPIAIASGALRHEIVGCLRREGLDRLFTAIVAAEDTPVSKPSPEPYRLAVARLRESLGALEPRECVAIEDSRWGLQSASAAGLRTVAVGQTYDAASLSADLVVDRITELDFEQLRAILS